VPDVKIIMNVSSGADSRCGVRVGADATDWAHSSVDTSMTVTP
jgi:hypothetical protein